MYYAVCSGVSSVLDDMPDGDAFREIRKRLTDVLLEAEDIYINTADILEMPGLSRKEGAIIFSASYPYEEELMETLEPLPLGDGKEWDNSILFRKRRSSRERKVTDADALKRAPRFIALAKELSEAYCVEMAIAAERYGIVASMYLKEYCYSNDFAHMLSQLMDMSDGFTVSISRSAPESIVIAPVLYTQI